MYDKCEKKIIVPNLMYSDLYGGDHCTFGKQTLQWQKNGKQTKWRIWSSLYLHFVLILDEIFSFYFEKYFVKYQEQLMNILQTVQKKLEMTQNSGNFLS